MAAAILDCCSSSRASLCLSDAAAGTAAGTGEGARQLQEPSCENGYARRTPLHQELHTTAAELPQTVKRNERNRRASTGPPVKSEIQRKIIECSESEG